MKVHIVGAPPGELCGTKTYLDGQEIPKVFSVEYTHRAGEPPEARVTCFVESFTGEAELVCAHCKKPAGPLSVLVQFPARISGEVGHHSLTREYSLSSLPRPGDHVELRPSWAAIQVSLVMHQAADPRPIAVLVEAFLTPQEFNTLKEHGWK
jgi:hypothetical protein